MQLFERWFAVWPDGGNGLLELAYAATAVAVLVAVAARRPLARAVRKLLARSPASKRRA